jgi:hypothetical protein
MAVPWLSIREDRAVLHVQNRNQRGRPVTFIVMRHSSTYPRPSRNIGCVRSRVWH